MNSTLTGPIEGTLTDEADTTRGRKSKKISRNALLKT
jgi:hypothetical protein